MVILDSSFNIKEEIPTARFWLMTKLRFGWEKRYSQYVSDLETFLISVMTVSNNNGNDTESKQLIKTMALQIVAKIEKSAWRTMPSEFLRQLDIPRVLRR